MDIYTVQLNQHQMRIIAIALGTLPKSVRDETRLDLFGQTTDQLADMFRNTLEGHHCETTVYGFCV